nr:hypothetical protein [Rhodoferax sp.]
MHHTSRQLLASLAATFTLLLAAGAARASGGDGYAQNSFVPESAPTTKDLPLYASGQIGVVPGSYWRVYQFLAYRAASGQPLTPAELQSLDIQGWKIGAIQGDSATNTEATDPYTAWLAVRKKIAGAAPIANLAVTKYDEVNYVEILNCADDALRRASITLAERLQSGGLVWAKVWLANQDAVFANCGLVTRVRSGKPKPASPMPAALPGDAPAWLRRDHAYQTAAALFYAGQFEAARQQFLTIAKDKASPWHSWGEYLAARSLIRKATLDRGEPNPSNAEYTQAEDKKWRSQLEQARTELAAMVATFPQAQGLLGWVDARIRPQARLAELASTLHTGRFSAASPRQLADYLLIWDAVDGPASQAQEPLTQWIAAMQGDRKMGLAAARQGWKAHGEPLWLMPLLAHAGAGELNAEEWKAAAAVPSSASAYVHLQYHLARLEVTSEKSVDADARISTLLQQTEHSVVTRNRLLGIKMLTAATREGFFQAAARQPAEPDTVGPITSEKTTNETTKNEAAKDTSAKPVAPASTPVATDGDYPRHLFRHFSLAELQKARPLAKDLQSRPLADVVWTRAIILGDYSVADSVTADVMVGRDTTHHLYRRYLDAKDPVAKRDAALLILANAPEFNANVGGDAWGCAVPVSPSADTDALGAAWPRFLSPEARAQATSEMQKLRALPKRSDYLGPLLLDYAQRNPGDAEVPKALHFFIASTRMECNYGDKPKRQKSFSQQAFERLKKRYPGNEWAVRTKYYY